MRVIVDGCGCAGAREREREGRWVRARVLTLSMHSIIAMLFPLTTTMPMSFLVEGVTCSTLWSNTMFMN